MKEQGNGAPVHCEDIQPTLRRLLETIEVELTALLASKQNFKVTINGSGGGRSVTVEVSKYVKL